MTEMEKAVEAIHKSGQARGWMDAQAFLRDEARDIADPCGRMFIMGICDKMLDKAAVLLREGADANR